MRILYDLMATQSSRGSKFHGGGEYAKIVFKHLVKNKKNAEIVCLYNKNNYLDKDIISIIKKNHLELLHIENKKAIQNIISTSKIDKIYSPLPYQFYGLSLDSLEFIFTIHGLRPIEMPTDRYEIKYAKNMRDIIKFIYKNIFKKRYIYIKKNQFNKLFKISKNIKIIVSSQHSKYSLLCYFTELKQKHIYVLYCPRQRAVPLNNIKRLENLNLSEKQFFLLINADRWIKNSFRAIQALDQIFSGFPEIKKKVLVLGSDKIKKFEKMVINKDKFIFHDYVERNVLEVLYKSAYCLIYPTLNEGFGYPPLESMKWGTPVISSAIASITEICQDGVLYFNPFSTEEIMNRILQLVFEPDIYERYSQKGIEIAKKVAIKQDQMLDNLINIILN